MRSYGLSRRFRRLVVALALRGVQRMQSLSPRLDAMEERAAIREYCGGMTRADAERLTARDAGYPSWVAAVADLRRAGREA